MRIELDDVIKCRDVEDPVNLHVHRPLQLALLRPLAKTGITPNQVTLLSLCAGLLSAALVFHGARWSLPLAALLLFASAILDGVDGMLARHRRASSDLGHALDGAADYAVNVATTAAGVFYLARVSGRPILAIVLGVAAHVAWAHHLMLYDFHSATFMRFFTRGGHRGGDVDRAHALAEKLRRGDASLFARLLSRVYAWQLDNRERFVERVHGSAARWRFVEADEPTAAAYVASHRKRMRAWAYLGNAPHMDLMVLATATGRFDLYFLTRIFGFTLLAIVLAIRERRRMALRLGLGATLLLTAAFYAPALLGGYMADDHYHLLALSDLKQAFHGWNLFSFVRTPAEVHIHREWGIAPWWTSDSFRIDFYRPLPSLTHWLDYALFGANAAAAHLVSIAWYLLAIVLVHRVYSRFVAPGSRALLLATVIFALDDTHALPVQWLANRNDVVAAVFFLTAFLGWLRVREGSRRYALNVVMLLGGTIAALLSKESSVVLPAVVLAHALLVPEREGASLVERLRPHRLLHLATWTIVLAYIGLYFAAGHGPNTLYYLNPTRNPVMWAEQLARSGFFHAVILATGVPLHVLSSSPVRDHPIVAGLLACITFAFWALVWRWLRHDRATRFFVAWMVLAQLVLTTSFPDPRLLFLPSIGFSWIVARLMQECWRRRAEWQPAKGVVATLAVLHLIAAPVLVQVCMHVVDGFQDGYALLRQGVRDNVDLEHLPPEGDRTEVFFLNCQQRESTALSNLYLLRNLPAGADVRPELARDDLAFTDKLDRAFGALRIHYYSLSFLASPIDVRVLNDHELSIAPRDGTYFPSLFDRLYLTTPTFHAGQTFTLRAFTATIEEVDGDGEVMRVRFTFPKPLTSASYRFLAFDGARWVAVVPHGPGPQMFALGDLAVSGTSN